MTSHQGLRPATRVYLHLNLAREQPALIRAPASGPQFARYRPCSPS
jgi:hypothetical protein